MSFEPKTMDEDAFREHLKVLERHSIEVQARVRQVGDRVFSHPDLPGHREFNPNLESGNKEIKDLLETIEVLSGLIHNSSSDLKFEFDVRLEDKEENTNE